MFMILLMTIIIIIIIFIMMISNFIISKKMFKFREKMSPFECGFDPEINMRQPFSLQFYLISVIFLIFDVEISLILPIIISMNNLYIFMIINLNILLLLLLFGFFIELKEGSFNWFK
uniref:NADH-ubiquinone oxidoreductase chain 3 n=1 Tax=Brachymeria sp. ZJUH_2016006 TaxID=2491152 RepID=A0A3S8V0C4_9HYME|nr:NADH dehydrogenase subunit 3 [Brachymeria sp. ZJUH_2016006]